MAKVVSEFIKLVFDRSVKSKCFPGHCLKHVKLVHAQDGICQAEFTVQEEHLNLGGSLHGGFTSSIVDCISSHALMSYNNTAPGASVDLHVTFLKAAFPGDEIFVDAKTIKVGQKLAFLEVELKNKGNDAIIARGIHTKYIGG